MATIRNQIAAAAVTALTQAGPVGSTSKPSSLTTDRYPLRSVVTANLPHQSVYMIRNDVLPRASSQFRHTLTLRIHTRAQITDGTPADEVLDPIAAWNHAALLEDHTLGGLAHDIVPGRATWAAEEQNDAYAELWTDFEITYSTSRTDLEAA